MNLDKELPPVVWNEPAPFLSSPAAQWPYQNLAHATDRILCTSFLRTHYWAWKGGRHDKQNHPMFYIHGGPGTGKSRLCQEFPAIVMSNCYDEPHFEGRFSKNVFVFNVSFAAETKWTSADANPRHAVALRMLFQLRGDRSVSFEEFRGIVQRKCDRVSSWDVLKKLSATISVPWRDMTVFLVCDGLEVFQEIDQFNICMDDIYGMFYWHQGPFVIACCSCTSPLRFRQTAHWNSRICITIPLLPLNGCEIIDTQGDANLRQLVMDMGGNGKALEVLQSELANYNNNRIGDWYIEVWENVMEQLAAWCHPKLELLFPILRFVFSGQPVNGLQQIVPGTTFSVDQVCERGLITYDETAWKLRVPFVWIHMLSITCEQPLFALACLPSQRVSCFNIAKSSAFEGQSMTLKQFHRGARFAKSFANTEVLAHRLKVLSSGSYTQPYPTLSLVTYYGNQHDGHFAFQSAHQADNQVKEVDLFLEGTLTSEFIADVKSKIPEDWIAVFYTPEDTTDEFIASLPPNTAIVSKRQQLEYFGPFALRFDEERKPVYDINSCTQAELEAHFGLQIVKRIMKERPYSSVEECANANHVSLSTLTKYLYSAIFQNSRDWCCNVGVCKFCSMTYVSVLSPRDVSR